MSTEVWKPVLGYEGYYEVSDLGNVRGLPRQVVHGGRSAPGALVWKTGKDLSPGRHVCGYLFVNLQMRGSIKPRTVHRIVLEAFCGPKPDGMEACHGNGIRTDNRLANLRWDTRRANHADKKIHAAQRRQEAA